jgi:hypothetical protein
MQFTHYPRALREGNRGKDNKSFIMRRLGCERVCGITDGRRFLNVNSGVGSRRSNAHSLRFQGNDPFAADKKMSFPIDAELAELVSDSWPVRRLASWMCILVYRTVR